MAFARDGDNRYLAVSGLRTIAIWDLMHAKLVMEISNLPAGIYHLQLLNGRLIVSLRDWTIRIMDLENEQNHQTSQKTVGFSGPVSSSSPSKGVAHRENPGSAMSHEHIQIFPPLISHESCRLLVFSPDGQFLAISDRRRIVMFDVHKGTAIPIPVEDPDQHCHQERTSDLIVVLCFSPDGCTLKGLGSVLVLELNSKGLQQTFRKKVPDDNRFSFQHRIAFSHNGAFLVSRYKQQVTVWNIETGKVHNQIDGLPGCSAAVLRVGRHHFQVRNICFPLTSGDSNITKELVRSSPVYPPRSPMSLNRRQGWIIWNQCHQILRLREGLGSHDILGIFHTDGDDHLHTVAITVHDNDKAIHLFRFDSTKFPPEMHATNPDDVEELCLLYDGDFTRNGEGNLKISCDREECMKCGS